jgi:hypothetical protein
MLNAQSSRLKAESLTDYIVTTLETHSNLLLSLLPSASPDMTFE